MNKSYILLTLLIIILITSCNTNKGYKVGFLVPNLTSERYVKEQQYFKDQITTLGGEVLLASADNDDKLQIEQAKEMINQGAKILVVNSVNMNTAAEIIRDAHNRKVKVIAYDRLIRNCDLDMYVSFDNTQVGKLMSEYVLKVKPEGNYIILGGDKADLNAVFVKMGQMDVLDNAIKTGKVKIVYNIFVEDWSTENAYQEIKSFLNLSGQVPDAILSSYDGMSLGAIKALDEAGLAGKVIVTGQDAELEACRNIMKDRQAMTVYKPLKTLATKAAEIAYKIASGEKYKMPESTIENGQKNVPALLLAPISVDKQNMKTTIIADGFYTESQVTSD